MDHIPLISVIVPVYNTKEYLDTCIGSIAEQTYTNLEIILVDDGSTDSCGELCDHWAMMDSRIHVIHKENGGAADAKNYGLKAFHGDFLAIVDSDDWIEQNMYERLYAILTEHNADIADSLAKKVKNRKETFDKNDDVRSYKVTEYDAEGALGEYLRDRTIRQTPWNKLYARNMVDGIFFVKGTYIDDEYWTYRVIDRCRKYVFTEEPFYYYYQREDSAMGNAYSIRRLDAIGAMEERYYLLKDKYPNLEKKLLENYLGACKFHYQMLCYYSGLDRDRRYRKELFHKIKAFDRKTLRTLYQGKNKIWFRLFLIAPRSVCKLRNTFKIGW